MFRAVTKSASAIKGAVSAHPSRIAVVSGLVGAAITYRMCTHTSTSSINIEHTRTTDHATVTTTLRIGPAKSETPFEGGSHMGSPYEVFGETSWFEQLASTVTEDQINILVFTIFGLSLLYFFAVWVAKSRLERITNFIYGPSSDTVSVRFTSWANSWREDIYTLRINAEANKALVIASTSLMWLVFEYCYISVTVLNDPAFSQLLPAYFVHMDCPYVLDNSIFTEYVAKVNGDIETVKKYLQLAAVQYRPDFSALDSWCYIFNQYELVHQVIRLYGFTKFIYFQYRAILLPISASWLDVLGLFNNTPKLEYAGMPYSEFMINGLINLRLVLAYKDKAGLSQEELQHVIKYLNYVASF